MRKASALVCTVVAGSLLAGTAEAAGPTTPAPITKLVSVADSYRVYGITATGCTYADYIDANTATTEPQRALMNKLLMSAFLAGKPVVLNISGCSTGGRPVYSWVSF